MLYDIKYVYVRKQSKVKRMSNLLSHSKNIFQYFSSLFVCLMEVAIAKYLLMLTIIYLFTNV